jgi:4-hydroxyproline epimerase
LTEATLSFSPIQVVDSHTAGEPTRVVISGGPALGNGPLKEQLRLLAEQHDDFRSAVVNEPRGSDVVVGALLCEPSEPGCAAGVIFFNNVGYLGMCGHGTIGLVTTLAYLGRITPGEHRIDTPVGVVHTTLHADRRVTVRNVASYRHRAGVAVTVPGYGEVRGDIAWGGNWFFLISESPVELQLAQVDALTEFAWAVRVALGQNGIRGAQDAEIDHIEVFAPSAAARLGSRNFVLCPGKAYDRSPCGTGTSAKLACLHADGKLAAGEVWQQEGILGTVFEGSYELCEGRVIPSITGSAWVTAEAKLLFDSNDPFRTGIRTV